LSGSASPLNVFGGLGLTGGVSFVGFDISATPFESDIWAAHCHSQLQNAAAPINATQQIASASHIVVTFNFRFCAHTGLNSDIAACPSCANKIGSRAHSFDHFVGGSQQRDLSWGTRGGRQSQSPLVDRQFV
jgi:hypothetical protein